METLMEQEEECTVTEEMLDISQLCRVCANPNEYLIPIFHGEGLEHDLKSKVSRHLPLQIRESDSLPVQLCYQCASTLIAWSDLVEGCSEADEKLRSMLPEGAQAEVTLDDKTGLPINEESFGLQSSAVSAKVLHAETSEAVANAEVIVEPDVSSMDEEAGAIEPAQQRWLTFGSYLSAVESQKKKLLGLNNIVKESKDFIKPKITVGYLITEQESISEDVTIDDNNVSSDDNNDSNLPTGEGESSQLKTKSKPTCNVCAKIFTRAYDLKRHMLVHYTMEALEKEKAELGDQFVDKFPDIRLFPCEVCKRNFKKRDNFERHMRIHTGELPFECDQCHRHFRDASARNRHVRNVHFREPKHKCEQCTKWFGSTAALRDHMLIHQEERTKQCSECGIMFKTEASLYQHKRGVHASELLPCSYCTKMFRRKQDLNNHLATHANEKNHVCDQCGKGFNTRNDLRRHIMIHSDESPFQCSECGSFFAHKRYLTAHIKTLHRK